MVPAMDSDRTETKEVMVRLPTDLHAQVKERAVEEERSMASTIRIAIKQYLKTSPAV